MFDPRTRHEMEQFGAAINEMGRRVAAYRNALIEEGVPKHEAWASAQRMEERWANILFAQMEAKGKTDEQRILEEAIKVIEEIMERKGLLTEDDLE